MPPRPGRAMNLFFITLPLTLPTLRSRSGTGAQEAGLSASNRVSHLQKLSLRGTRREAQPTAGAGLAQQLTAEAGSGRRLKARRKSEGSALSARQMAGGWRCPGQERYFHPRRSPPSPHPPRHGQQQAPAFKWVENSRTFGS